MILVDQLEDLRRHAAYCSAQGRAIDVAETMGRLIFAMSEYQMRYEGHRRRALADKDTDALNRLAAIGWDYLANMSDMRYVRDQAAAAKARRKAVGS